MADRATVLTLQTFSTAHAKRAVADSIIKLGRVRKAVALFTAEAVLYFHTTIDTWLVVTNEIETSSMLRTKVFPQIKVLLQLFREHDG